MFGKNAITKREIQNYKNTVSANSIFYTIQGEGPFSGVPAIFIRLKGCNLQCSFCDTEFDSGVEYDVDDIVRMLIDLLDYRLDSSKKEQFLSTLDKPLVVITGGEPFLQANLAFLCEKLIKKGFLVQIETAGTVSHENCEILIPYLLKGDLVIVCSPKTGILDHFIESYASCFKYVLQAGKVDTEDGLPVLFTEKGTAIKVARPYRNVFLNKGPFYGIYISPCDEYDEEKNAANLVLVSQVSMRFGYRVSLQIHKYLNLA